MEVDAEGRHDGVGAGVLELLALGVWTQPEVVAEEELRVVAATGVRHWNIHTTIKVSNTQHLSKYTFQSFDIKQDD